MRITIIGAGPGGYETAVAAAAKGIEVTIISDGPVGGTCLNEGCIPTKSLCRNAEVLEDLARSGEFGIEVSGDVSFDMARAMSRKNAVVDQLRGGVEFLLKNKLIRLVYGRADFKDSHTVIVTPAEGGVPEEIASDYIIVATGSVSATLPIPGADLEDVITSREILSLDTVPKRLCVIGAGVIGLEFASIFKSFGAEVSVVEYCKDILPRFDTDLAKRLKQALGKRGISIETAAAVQSVEKADDGSLVVKYVKKDKEFEVAADKVLMAVGRRPAVQSLNFAAAGVEFTPKGVVTDANMRTSVPNIFAVGDIRGGMMLAHVATFEGYRALNAILADGDVPGSAQCPVNDGINLDIVPAAVFTYPEAAVVGMTEDDCKNAGIPVRCLKSFFRANGKALSMGEPEGFCKIVISAEGAENPGRILGCHMFGAHSSDIIQEIAALMNTGAGIDKFKTIIHAHPTLTEVLQSAAHS